MIDAITTVLARMVLFVPFFVIVILWSKFFFQKAAQYRAKNLKQTNSKLAEGEQLTNLVMYSALGAWGVIVGLMMIWAVLSQIAEALFY